MQCFGRNIKFKRCNKRVRFFFCKKHLIPVIGFLFCSIPALIVDWMGLYSFFSSGHIAARETQQTIIRIQESMGDDGYLINQEMTFSRPDLTEKPIGFNYDNGVSKDEYYKILALHKNKKFVEAKKSICKEFVISQLQDHDEYLGYIVSTYFVVEEYDKAAETVLERNRTRRRWDQSLKLDLAKCLRFYRLTHTLPDAIQLVNSLLHKYKDPLLSYFWLVLPYQSVNMIESGIYNSKNGCINEKNTLNEIKYIYENYPNDPFRTYGCFFLNLQTEFISKHDPDSRISDVCLYGFAIRNISELEPFINANCKMYFYVGSFKPKNSNHKLLIENSILFLKRYVTEFPQNVMADDAAFWLSFLYCILERYNESIDYLNLGLSLGNSDYVGLNKQRRVAMINGINLTQNQIKGLGKFLLNDANDNDYSRFDSDRILRYYYLNELSTSELLLYANHPSKYLFIDAYLIDLLRNEDYRKAFILMNKIKGDSITFNFESFEYILQIRNVINISLGKKSQHELKRSLIQLKNKNPLIALNVINSLLKQSSIIDIEYLFYLKIRILVNLSPNNVYDSKNVFLKSFSKSKYCDDIIAESIFVDLLVLNFPERAFSDFKNLCSLYPGANSIDNTLNTIARYLDKFTEESFFNYKENIKHAIEINELILNHYKFGSYSDAARDRLKKYKDVKYY